MADHCFRTIYIEEIDGMYEWPDRREAWEHYMMLLQASLEDEPLTDERLAEIGRLLGPALQ